MEIKVKRLPNFEGDLPQYKYLGDSGMDIRSQRDTYLFPRATEKIPTGLAFQIPFGYELQVRSRSGLASQYGVMVLNSPGTVDSNFLGEVIIILHNSGSKGYQVKKGDRIAQLVLCPVLYAELKEVDGLTISPRGTNGLGSTGVN